MMALGPRMLTQCAEAAAGASPLATSSRCCARIAVERVGSLQHKTTRYQPTPFQLLSLPGRMTELSAGIEVVDHTAKQH